MPGVICKFRNLYTFGCFPRVPDDFPHFDEFYGSRRPLRVWCCSGERRSCLESLLFNLSIS